MKKAIVISICFSVLKLSALEKVEIVKYPTKTGPEVFLQIDPLEKMVSFNSISSLSNPYIEMENENSVARKCKKLKLKLDSRNVQASDAKLYSDQKVNFHLLYPLHSEVYTIKRYLARQYRSSHQDMYNYSYQFQLEASDYSASVKFGATSYTETFARILGGERYSPEALNRYVSGIKESIERSLAKKLISELEEQGPYQLSLSSNNLPLLCDLASKKISIKMSFLAKSEKPVYAPTEEEQKKIKQVMETWKDFRIADHGTAGEAFSLGFSIASVDSNLQHSDEAKKELDYLRHSLSGVSGLSAEQVESHLERIFSAKKQGALVEKVLVHFE